MWPARKFARNCIPCVRTALHAAQVPSGFLLTDVWLMLNQKMRMGLVKPALLKTGQHDTVWNHAAKEAKRLKKPMGSLRYLFRNGNEDANLRLYLNTFGWVADAAFELPLHMGEQERVWCCC